MIRIIIFLVLFWQTTAVKAHDVFKTPLQPNKGESDISIGGIINYQGIIAEPKSDQKTQQGEEAEIIKKAFLKGKESNIDKKSPILVRGKNIQKNPEDVIDWLENINYQNLNDAQNNEVKTSGQKSMGEAISNLSVLTNLNEGVNLKDCQHQGKNCLIFGGVRRDCVINPVGARNCCRDNGWLKNMNILGCSESEKILGQQKEKGLCHYVGERCNRRRLKICSKRSRVYCCFNSKIARIIQEQGRRQLGVGWGDANNPSCSPLSIEQVQSLDLGKMNFSEMYKDIYKNVDFSKSNQGIDNIKDKISNITVDNNLVDEVTARFRRHYEK